MDLVWIGSLRSLIAYHELALREMKLQKIQLEKNCRRRRGQGGNQINGKSIRNAKRTIWWHGGKRRKFWDVGEPRGGPVQKKTVPKKETETRGTGSREASVAVGNRTEKKVTG